MRPEVVVVEAAAFVVGSPKGDLGHLGDLLLKRGLLKVTFFFKSLLSDRKDGRNVFQASFCCAQSLVIIIPVVFNKH